MKSVAKAWVVASFEAQLSSACSLLVTRLIRAAGALGSPTTAHHRRTDATKAEVEPAMSIVTSEPPSSQALPFGFSESDTADVPIYLNLTPGFYPRVPIHVADELGRLEVLGDPEALIFL